MLELQTANAIGDIKNINQIFNYPNVPMVFIEIIKNMLKSALNTHMYWFYLIKVVQLNKDKHFKIFISSNELNTTRFV